MKKEKLEIIKCDDCGVIFDKKDAHVVKYERRIKHSYEVDSYERSFCKECKKSHNYDLSVYIGSWSNWEGGLYKNNVRVDSFGNPYGYVKKTEDTSLPVVIGLAIWTIATSVITIAIMRLII